MGSVAIICEGIVNGLKTADENIIDCGIQPEGGRVEFGHDPDRDDNPYFTVTEEGGSIYIGLWMWHPIKEGMSQRGDSVVDQGDLSGAIDAAIEMYWDWF